MNIGEQILFLRKNKGITQEQLATKLGVSNQAVSKWESGQCYPDIQLLPEISEYFNVSIDELMGVPDKNNDDDILITIKNNIQNSYPGTEMAQIMKIVKALHAIVLVMESKKENSGYPEFELDSTIDHAIQNEWGLSSITLPQIVATMRRGSVFFSDDHNIYDENSIKKISKLLKSLSDKLALSVLFAIYEITSVDENLYASVDELRDMTDLTEDMIRSILDGDLAQYCIKKKIPDAPGTCSEEHEYASMSESYSVRIKGEFMNIPPILSILYPSV